MTAFGDSGHPFAKVDSRRVVIDRRNHTMAVTYELAPGPAMRFGGVAITGLKTLNPGYVERRLRWRRGAAYDAAKVEQTRRALIESGLFSTVRITPQAEPGRPGSAQMTIDATERPHRTIGAGLGYNTSQGAAARIFWENRNLFGNAEYLRLSATAGQQVYGLNANFRRPDTFATDQDFLATAEIANETPSAYHSRRALATAGFERRFGRLLTGGVLLEGEEANVEATCRFVDDHLGSAHPALHAGRRPGLCKARHHRQSVEPEPGLAGPAVSHPGPYLFKPEP